MPNIRIAPVTQPFDDVALQHSIELRAVSQNQKKTKDEDPFDERQHHCHFAS
jgi:hypothetical protein